MGLRRLGPGCRLVLAWLLAAGWATAQPVPPATGDTTPARPDAQQAQRTALATRADLRFVLTRQRTAAGVTSVLAWLPDHRPPEPVARLVQVQDGKAVTVAVQLLAPPATAPAAEPADQATPAAGRATSAASRADVAIATLEQLYSLVLRQEPEARYCPLDLQAVPAGDATACQAPALPQAALLADLAERRTHAARQTPSAVPWQVVALQAAPQRSWDADLVSVQALGPQGPLAGIPVYFNRAPHSICQARTGGDGVATCRLQDQHADGHQHDHAVAVVATFPGDLRPAQVWLPTTQVLRPHADAASPAFASRWLLPGPVATP